MNINRMHSFTAGVCTTIASLLCILAAVLIPKPYGFWEPYVLGLRGLGYVLLLLGLLLAFFGGLHKFAKFFDLNNRLSAEGFLLWLVGTVAACGLALYIVIPKVPQTPPERMPPEMKDQIKVERADRNFRSITGAFIILSGLVFVSVPFRRFLRT